MSRSIFWAFLLLLASSVLGATVFSDQIANASSQDKPATPVLEQNVDANGNIRTHEQGTANVALGAADAARLDAANSKLDIANGQLANVASQTAKLTFDGGGNLKTAPQGAQTVHVENTVVTSAVRPNSFAFADGINVDAGQSHTFVLSTAMVVSLIAVGGTDDSIRLRFFRPDGVTVLVLYGSGLGGADSWTLPLTTPIVIGSLEATCVNTIETCRSTFSMVGSAL